MPKSICRSTAECIVRISWTLEREFSCSSQSSFYNSSQSSYYRSEENVEKSECDGRGREEMLKEDLERNVSLCLHNSF